MKKVNHPYIGICNVKASEQVTAALEVFKENEPQDLYIKVGANTTYDIVHGNYFDGDYLFPQLDHLASIFSTNDGRLINCIHYSDSKNNKDLAETLTYLVSKCGRRLDAIQLDMVLPDPAEIQKFSEKFPSIGVILKISNSNFGQGYTNPVGIAHTIRDRYISEIKEGDNVIRTPIISQVVFEYTSSNAIDASTLEEYVEQFLTKVEDVPLTIAGKFNSLNAKKALPHIKKHRLSIDAYCVIHDEGQINLELVRNYIASAYKTYYPKPKVKKLTTAG